MSERKTALMYRCMFTRERSCETMPDWEWKMPTDDYIKRSDVLDFLQIIPIDLGYREIDDVEQYVKNAPAADVEPVRHGRWKISSGDDRLMCSICKCKEYVPTFMMRLTVWGYCPNCGAKMDKEEA